MENKPLLSICIPTYSRADYLRQCLESIAVQFDNENVKNSIEVVVSDNASPDNTKEIVQGFQTRFSNIKYFRNDENLGMDRNIMNSVLKASGKYCWHIGDDDLVQNGALELILRILAQKEVSVLTVNFHPFFDTKKSSEKISYGENYNVEYLTSAEEFCNKQYTQAILGVFMFQREPWLKIDKTNYEFLWSCFEFIFKMMGTNPLPMAHLHDPVLYTGQDYRWNKGGTSLKLLAHGRRFMKKLKGFGYGDQFIKSGVHMYSKGLFRITVSAKAHDFDCSFKNLVWLYKEFYDYPVQLFLTTLIYFIPNYFFKIALQIKKR